MNRSTQHIPQAHARLASVVVPNTLLATAPGTPDRIWDGDGGGRHAAPTS